MSYHFLEPVAGIERLAEPDNSGKNRIVILELKKYTPKSGSEYSYWQFKRPGEEDWKSGPMCSFLALEELKQLCTSGLLLSKITVILSHL